MLVNIMTRNEKYTNNISSVVQSQMSRLNINFTTLFSRFEDDRKTWQSHVVVFMIMFSVSVLLAVIFLIVMLKKQSVKVTPNTVMSYQAGVESLHQNLLSMTAPHH